MFYYVSKIAGFLAQPSNVLILVLLFGVALLWGRYARAGRRIILVSALLLLVAGLSPLGHAIILPLEERFARTDLSDGPAPTGIIVLGGAQDMLVSAARRQMALTEAGERIVDALALARRYPDARIVFSGGGGGVVYNRASEAHGTAKILGDLGVAPERILLEDRSRNTYENAVFTKKLVAPEPGQRWLLVTSANHMPRAMGCFRRAGFVVEPWPVDYRTRGSEDLRRFFYRASSGLRRVDIAARQWAGLLAYRLTGRTDALFPAP